MFKQYIKHKNITGLLTDCNTRTLLYLCQLFVKLRKFVKSCKIPAYTRKMKELIGKLTETSSAIVERRRAATLNLQDLSAVVRKLAAYVFIV